MSFPRNSAFSQSPGFVIRDLVQTPLAGDQSGEQASVPVENRILEGWYDEMGAISAVLRDPSIHQSGVQKDLEERALDLRDAIYNYLR